MSFMEKENLDYSPRTQNTQEISSVDKKKEEESFKNQTEQFMMDNSNTMKKMDKER